MNCPEHLVIGSRFLYVWMWWRDVPRERIPLKVWPVTPEDFAAHTHLLEAGPVKISGDAAAVSQAASLLRMSGNGYKPVTPAGGEVEQVAWIAADNCLQFNEDFMESGRWKPDVVLYTGPARCSDCYEPGATLCEDCCTHRAESLAEATHPPVADAALVRDAERYRWLRTPGKAQTDVAYSFTGAKMDAAVDAALTAALAGD